MDDPALTDRILGFIADIGIPVRHGEVPDGVLPGMKIVDGGMVVDRERLAYPGDLLHDAGHIAVTDPALRPTLSDVSNDPAEEMATIAWSYAAALAIGIDPEIVFHAGGYRGGGNYIATAFADGALIGQPMLRYWGMTSDEKFAEADGRAPFPVMDRWLR